MKRTLIIGASSNPERYALQAAGSLVEPGKENELLGLGLDTVFNRTIHTEKIQFSDIDTVTLYVGPKNQPMYYDYVIAIKPKRVLFNPGTENPEFQDLLKKNDIAFEECCTLVLLSTNQY